MAVFRVYSWFCTDIITPVGAQGTHMILGTKTGLSTCTVRILPTVPSHYLGLDLKFFSGALHNSHALT